jgi:hypothetical protein
LQLFGLLTLEDLPRGEELRASPLPAAPPWFPLPAEPHDEKATAGDDAADLDEVLTEPSEHRPSDH